MKRLIWRLREWWWDFRFPRCNEPMYGYGRCALERGHEAPHQYEDMEP